MDKPTIARVARLARLKVPEAQLDQVAGEIGGILKWIEQLGEVDVKNVEPVASVHAMHLRWRDDVVTDGNQTKAVLQNAPKAAADFFVVAKVIE